MSNISIYKTYHYTYWITNVKEQKHYIGVRSSKIPPIKDLGIKYFSSSLNKDFKKAQKSTPDFFEYKVLNLFNTRHEAVLSEIELHNTFEVATNPKFYNKMKQSSTGFDSTGVSPWCKGKKFSENHRKKISNALKGKPLNRTISDEEKLKRKSNGLKRWTDPTEREKQSKRLKGKFIGKKGTTTGRVRITDGITSKFVNPNDVIPEGWILYKFKALI